MEITNERIKELRVKAKMTQEELAAKLGLTKGAIGNYETGRRRPDKEVLNAIADFFNVSMDYLNGRTTEQPEYTLEEQWLIDCYRKTDSEVKAAVKTILRKMVDQPVEKPCRIIPLFPAAAGPGEPIEGNAFDDFKTEDEKADFAVRISGDSMEPEFHEGDIVLCRRQEVKTGDIAVVMVNGSLLVKQFAGGYNGQFYLLSLNRERQDYTFLPSGNDTVTLFGVVMHKRIPLVEQ